MPEPRTFDDALERLSGVLIGDADLDSVMQLILALAASLTTCDAASVSVLTAAPKNWETINATTSEVVELDHVQYASRRGPCVEAILTGKTIVTDLASDAPQWPEFVSAARAEGVTSVYSQPLETPGETQGGLNLYSYRPNAINEWESDKVEMFGRSAAVLLANMTSFQTTIDTNAHLNLALETREQIGIAKGILMQRYNVNGDQAFDRLRILSQHSNRKLHDIARDIIAGDFEAGLIDGD